MSSLVTPNQPYRATPGEFLALLFAYMDLLLACWKARAQQLHPRENAVALSHLRAQGVGGQLLLWMLYQAHVEHVQQVPAPADSLPRPQPVESLCLLEGSSFALTERGEDFANDFLADVLLPCEEGAFGEVWDGLLLGETAPRYDCLNRLFTWGLHVLKHFRQPSVNQEIILCTAEEMRWPAWFDDPLPRAARKSPKKRLHDTIQDLNRRQTQYLVHFKGDGTGRRIGWEYR
jgi:hypothetical protein